MNKNKLSNAAESTVAMVQEVQSNLNNSEGYERILTGNSNKLNFRIPSKGNVKNQTESLTNRVLKAA